MSAQEVIANFNALPPEERQKVIDFCKSLPFESKAVPTPAKPTRNMKALIERVFDEHDELFRKLAQDESATSAKNL